jgi:tellurite resistance protein
VTTSSERIPLNTFAIAFGLAGLAEAWTAAGRLFRWPDAVGWAFWAVAAVAWVALLVAHGARGARTGLRLRDQLRHPAQGPIAALVPVVAMLLGEQLVRLQPVAGAVVIAVAVVVAALFAGWMLSLWMSGDRPVDAVHGGYFLPTVAAGFIGASALQAAGWHVAALASFAVAALFWIVIQAILLARLAFRPPLPDALMPTLMIQVAPPAVGGLAWLELTGDRFDAVQAGLTGLLVVLLLSQAFLFPRFRRLRFTIGFWSFTFPLAAAGTYGIAWAGTAAAPWGAAAGAAILAGVTALIAGIGIRTIVDAARDRSRGRDDADVTAVAAADDEAASA